MAEMQTRRFYNDGIPEATLCDDNEPKTSHGRFNPPSTVPPPSYNVAMTQLSGGQGQYVAECNKLVRLGFFRRVYGILTIQLLVTGIICALAMRSEGKTVNGYRTMGMGTTLVSSMALQICIFVLSFVLLFVLFCYKNKYPANMTLLSVWTISMALTVATSCAMSVCDPLVSNGTLTNTYPASQVIAKVGYQDASKYRLYDNRLVCALGTAKSDDGTQAVILAGFLTMIIFASFTIFTFQSRIDFSFMGAGLSMGLLLLIMWGIVMSLFGFGSPFLYAAVGTVIFSLYILYDTWRLIHVYGPDDAILAAIDLYLDIVNLFVMLLQLLRSDN